MPRSKPTTHRAQPGWVLRRLAVMISMLVLSQLTGCTTQPQIDAVVSGIAPAQSTMLEQRARIDVRIQNFSERTISASGISLELDVNGKRFARGVSNQTFSVPALGESMASVVVSISVFDMVRQLLGLEGRETFDYVLSGKVFGAGTTAADYRFKHRGELTRDQLATFGSRGAQ